MFSSPQLTVLVVLALVASAINAFPNPSDDTVVEIITLDRDIDFENFINSQGLIPLSRSQSNNLQYKFGSRNVTRDRVVAQGGGMRSSSDPKDYQLHLIYPPNGDGALITYVEIDVQQNSQDGQVRILSGGPNQRKIAFELEANNTYFFKYSFKIYGIY